MRRITSDELETIRNGLLSHDHLHNTAQYYQIAVTDVTAEQLIRHWERHHPIRMEVVYFHIEESLFVPEAALFCATD